MYLLAAGYLLVKKAASVIENVSDKKTVLIISKELTKFLFPLYLAAAG